MTDGKSEYYLDPTTGQRYVMNKLGGTPASDGDDAGLIVVEDKAMAFGPIYNDGTYKYFGEAAAGTLTTASTWRVSRMRLSDSYIQWVDSGSYTQVYNVEATIIALTYV